MCYGCGGNVIVIPAKVVKIVFGEKGLMLVEYIGKPKAQPVIGEITRQAYPFHLKARMYVDRRDAVYMLNGECREVAQ